MKSIGDFKQEDSFYINVLNERFGLLAVDIVSQRHQFVQQINQVLPKIYQEIMNDDKLEFRYISNVSYEEERSVMLDTFKKKLEGSFSREKQYGMTLIVPHRDDFAFFLKGKDLSIYGSQGQIRAAILALKLAELAIFKDKDADYPILLLDDIFSELDVEKRNRLVKYILDDVQTIITTTDIDMIDQSLVQQAKVFHVCGGKIVDDGKRECKDE